MRWRRSSILALCLCGLLLNACAKKTDGGSPRAGSEESGGKKNVCDVYTKENLEAVLLQPISEVSYDAASGDGACNYFLAEALYPEYVAIRFYSGGGELEETKTAFTDEEEVQGVGEEAIWVESVRLLSFVKGEESWSVQLIPADSAAFFNKDIAIRIAKDVANRAA